jgi:hypothetical protein
MVIKREMALRRKLAVRYAATAESSALWKRLHTSTLSHKYINILQYTLHQAV